jgi:hypothetical protein
VGGANRYITGNIFGGFSDSSLKNGGNFNLVGDNHAINILGGNVAGNNQHPSILDISPPLLVKSVSCFDPIIPAIEPFQFSQNGTI